MAPSSSSTTASTSKSNILALNFNQDASCVAVGTRQGYRIVNCEPFGKVFSKDDGPVSIVEMLFCTSLVALVGTPDSNSNASPRRLQIVNTKRQSTICELLFPTTILGVKLNRRRLVVVLEEEIYIYDISNMKLLHTIETSPNPQAICALTSSSDPCYLAYPSPVPSPSSPFSSTSTSPGDVLIFDLLTLSVVNIIQAHKTPISALSLNSTGSLLATASDKGTIIRVFSIPNANKKAQFRRGVHPTKIFSLSFNAVSSLLSVSSQTGTVHIFKLDENGMPGNNNNGGSGGKKDKRKLLGNDDESENGSENGGFNNGNGGGGYEAFIDDRKKSGGLSGTLRRSSQAFSRSVGGSVGGYLPNSLAEMWEPSRDFAFLKLPNGGVGSMVAVSSTTPQVMVVTSEGYLYCYNIDLEQGGECVLMKQHSLLDGADTSNGGSSIAE